MGMDIHGLNPTSQEGQYFGANIASWRPLAAFCLTVAPEECKPCGSWITNDGNGLNADQSSRLAQRLEAALVDGSLERCVPPVQHEDTPFRPLITGHI
jgi:hypothetical protein